MTFEFQNRRFKHLLPGILIMLLGVSFQAAAASSTLFAVDLSPCASIKKDSRRIACYDELAEMQASKSAGALNTVNTVEKNNDLEAEEFGIEKTKTKAESTQELIGRVVKIKEISPNKRLISLANGQIWRQMGAENFFIRNNDSVRIYKRSSRKYFRLSVEGRSKFIQVKRVK